MAAPHTLTCQGSRCKRVSAPCYADTMAPWCRAAARAPWSGPGCDVNRVIRCILLDRPNILGYKYTYRTHASIIIIWVKFSWRDILPNNEKQILSLTLHYSNIFHCRNPILFPVAWNNLPAAGNILCWTLTFVGGPMLGLGKMCI